MFGNWGRWRRRPALAAKASQAGPMVAMNLEGQPRWTPRRYDRLAEEGYRKNVIAYRCIQLVARAAAQIPVLLYDGTQELVGHPALRLLREPCPGLTGYQLRETLLSYYLISGNAYLEAVTAIDDEMPRELYPLRPDRMRVIPGTTGLPQGYDYQVAGRTTRWAADPLTGDSPILHWKAFHPLDDWYGLSPLEAALMSVDQHNAAGAWNQALLNRGARPSGALVYAPKEGPAHLSDEQFRRLKEELEEQQQGFRNAGRPLLLEGGLEWREMSLSPKDMDWLRGRDVAARDIALAFGVPAQLIGIPDAQTYANVAEARLALYEETVIPLAQQLAAVLGRWLLPRFGAELRFDLDLDQVSALAPRREALWSKLENASFLSVAERREAAGYDPSTGNDQ